LIFKNFVEISALRHRPRGIGLVKLPFGVSDHRSGPAFPNLYIAGNKLYHKLSYINILISVQSVPDVSLPGQNKHFSGSAQFNPFTQIIGFAHNNDIGDSWGSGFAMHGINFQDHDVRRNYKALADLPKIETDGMYQPFGMAFLVGAEVDFIKFRSHAVALDIPLLGLNEIDDIVSIKKLRLQMFDFETEILEKLDREFEEEEVEEGHGEHKGHHEDKNQKEIEFVTKEVVDVHHSRISLPIPSSDERFPFKQHFFDRFNDVQINYGQVLPHINYANIDHRDIIDRLLQNRANPTLIG
uniref:Peptidase A1 domain-containing protein n=1 Tax=Thelazia callipaeda TaxID=103827 RepID=A0A0N5CX48_THECL